MYKSRFAFLAVLICTSLGFAQDTTTKAVRNWRQSNEHAIISEYVEFIKIPNLAADPAKLRKMPRQFRRCLKSEE